MLSEEIKDEWDEEQKKQWRINRRQMDAQLATEYGSHAFQSKQRNFIEFGDLPFSVIAFHNKFLRQIRNSFVVGAYYPALTAACSLGERILNHLMITLRDHFKATPEYKHVYRKDSFDDWDLAINTLASWGVLLPNVVSRYQELKIARNKAIHFQPDVDENDRELALEAIKLLVKIIGEQFGAGAGGYYQPWFIEGTKGAFFIKKTGKTTHLSRRFICQTAA